MRKLGIDFGTKKVGLALTDEAGQMAFPHGVIPNDNTMLDAVEALIADQAVTEIVIGHSLALDGTPNAVQADIEAFIADLTMRVPLPIHLEPEQLTSIEAARTTGKNDQIDAAAAAIILNTYLARERSTAQAGEPVGTDVVEDLVDATPEITFEQFLAVEIKVGTILTAEVVENADKLLRLTVDVGESAPRQIVSGIREYFFDEQALVGRQCPFVTNLATRKIKGLESQGMILAGSTDDLFSLLHPATTLPPGTRLC